MGNWFSGPEVDPNVNTNTQLIEISQGKLEQLSTANEQLTDIKFGGAIILSLLILFTIIYALKSLRKFMKRTAERVVRDQA